MSGQAKSCHANTKIKVRRKKFSKKFWLRGSYWRGGMREFIIVIAEFLPLGIGMLAFSMSSEIMDVNFFSFQFTELAEESGASVS